MILHHGTTLKRAEAILRDGPNLKYLEQHGYEPANGFSMARPEQRQYQGRPIAVARGKAKAFPDEGGPAILIVEVPDEIAELAGEDSYPEYRFEPGYGYEELVAQWQSLAKQIVKL